MMSLAATNAAVKKLEFNDKSNAIVVIGAGPVGVRVALNLVKQNTDLPIIVYGDEPWHPYNRVRLTELLS